MSLLLRGDDVEHLTAVAGAVFEEIESRGGLEAESDEVYVVMQLSEHMATASFKRVRNFLFSITGLSLLLAITGSFWLAKTVTRPVQDLARDEGRGGRPLGGDRTRGRDRVRRSPDRRARDRADQGPMSLSYDLSDEHELIRTTVREFAEQRIAHDHRARRTMLVGEGLHRRPETGLGEDERVKNGIDLLPGLCVGKYQFAQLVAAQCAAVVHDFFAKGILQIFETGRTRPHDVSRHLVEVDDGHAEFTDRVP